MSEDEQSLVTVRGILVDVVVMFWFGVDIDTPSISTLRAERYADAVGIRVK